MNPMILKLMSSLLNCSPSNTAGPFKSEKGKGQHFLTNMLKAVHASRKKSFCMLEAPTIARTNLNRTEMSSNKKGFNFYIESLKKEILAQGKPFNKIFLKENDLPLIKKLLLQCGFSSDKVESFLTELRAGNPAGEISLSHLFMKIAELEPPGSKEQQKETVPLSAIPYIESTLRDFDFTPKELDRVFSSARVEGGGLDLHRFVKKLREISDKRLSSHNVFVHQSRSEQNSNMMEMIGISMDNKGKSGQISLENFIASLEQITGYGNTERQVPPEVKGILDTILERVKLFEQKPTSSPSVKVSSTYDFTHSLVKEEGGEKGSSVRHEKMIPSFEKNTWRGDDAVSSFLKQKDGKVIHQVRPNTDISNPSGKGGLLSDLGKKVELINSVKENSNPVKTETVPVDIPRNTAALNLADAVKSVEYGEKVSKGYLPASLLDQVGRQIARSILRGDQVLRLQLKPPELGMVGINIDIKDHKLKLAMIAEHSSVKDLLLNNVHELREALVQQGVKLEKVDVQISYNFGQTLNGSKEGMDNRQEWRQDFNRDQFLSDNHTEAPQARSISRVSGDNLLDLVA